MFSAVRSGIGQSGARGHLQGVDVLSNNTMFGCVYWGVETVYLRVLKFFVLRKIMIGLYKYLRDTRGSAAVEFAIVSMFFLSTLLFILCAGMLVYISQAVEAATVQASRQIVTGSAQKSSISQADFRQSICGYLTVLLSCDNLIVNLYTTPRARQPNGYYSYVNSDQSALLIPPLTPGSTRYDLGKAGDYQYLQVIYPVTVFPAIFAPIFGAQATFRGAPAYLAISNATFRNEQY